MYNRKSYDARRVEEKKRVRTEPNRYESPYGGM